jgi:hypothetical protein
MIGESLSPYISHASKLLLLFFLGVPLHFTPGYQHATPAELNSQLPVISVVWSNPFGALLRKTSRLFVSNNPSIGMRNKEFNLQPNYRAMYSW